MTLRDKLKALKTEVDGSLKAENRTQEQIDRMLKIPNEIASVKAQIDAEDKLKGFTEEEDEPVNNLPFPTGKKKSETKSEDGPVIEPLKAEVEKKALTGGFRSVGHFCWAVTHLATSPRPEASVVKSMSEWRHIYNVLASDLAVYKTDEENYAAAVKAAAGMGITGDPTAEIFVPMEFSREIFRRREGISSDLVSRCRQMTIRGSSIRLPAWNDKNRGQSTRAGGVITYWEGEGDAATATKPTSVRFMELRPKRLTGLVYVTDELIQDAVGLESYINEMSAEALSFAMNRAVFEGAGVLQPLGVKSHACVVSVAKESGQTAATFVAANVDKMFMRFTAGYRANAVWHINQDCEQQLQTMFYATGTNAGQLVYMPPNGISGSPYATLKGLPVIPLEFCETLGTEYDILLADWSNYMVVTKGAAQRDVSMHVRFTTHEQAFRFSIRMDGQPLWDAPITPLKGSNTTSCFVSLAVRA